MTERLLGLRENYENVGSKAKKRCSSDSGKRRQIFAVTVPIYRYDEPEKFASIFGTNFDENYAVTTTRDYIVALYNNNNGLVGK